MLRVASNKSVLGNSGAAIVGCGLNVSESSNVIIRNIAFRDWGDDAINVQYSTRVWVDHNSFSNGFGVSLVPETWIVDPSGVVRARIISQVTADGLGALINQLKGASR